MVPPPREATREVVLTPAFLVALEELLDRRQRQAAAQAACPIELYYTEEVTSRPQAVPMQTPCPQVFPLLASAASQGTCATMAPPLGIMTREEIKRDCHPDRKGTEGWSHATL